MNNKIFEAFKTLWKGEKILFNPLFLSNSLNQFSNQTMIRIIMMYWIVKSLTYKKNHFIISLKWIPLFAIAKRKRASTCVRSSQRPFDPEWHVVRGRPGWRYTRNEYPEGAVWNSGLCPLWRENKVPLSLA